MFEGNLGDLLYEKVRHFKREHRFIHFYIVYGRLYIIERAVRLGKLKGRGDQGQKYGLKC